MSAPAPRWVPTHVQVTVLRARGLRSKAAEGQGGSDAYAVMAVGRDKFSTSVAERCQGEPLWREEATFELPPPPRPVVLRLTVMHRALVGLDKFLGRAEVDLAALREDGGRRHSRWYKLRSKPGKKEKERGEIEVDIQFMRSNMTASMFDLSMKDKTRSPFGKLKDKLKGKRSSGLSDTASAIVPSTTHSPADSEDEAPEKEKKKSKFKTLFSKPGLRKNSLSQSMSVLPTPQPVDAGVRHRPKDFHLEWDDEDLETSPTSERTFEIPLDEESSPSVFKHIKAATLDTRQLNQPTPGNTKKEGLSLFSGLRSKNDPVSKSSLCINGSHVYMEEKDSTPASSPSPRNFRKKQVSASEENLFSRSTKGPEEMGRTSPSNAMSGSASLETFKALSLPSYKLLSGEEYVETSVPVSVEVTKETKKTDQKKSSLLSLVTGKKEAAKNSDAESIPDRTQKEEENKAAEEKSEQETKRLEPPTDLSRGNPSADSQPEAFTSKQPLNPFEEERKPEKAAAPAKAKAVKPRLGLSSEEETKATLPTLAPDSLPAYLSLHHINSDNNPFVSKMEQKVPDSEGITSASLPSFTAEHLSGKNPFNPSWGRGAPALGTDHVAIPSSHHLAASAPKGQISHSGNNPFASEWGRDPEGSDAYASTSPLPAHSLHSGGHFNGNNPFISKTGWGVDVPGLTAVTASSPVGLPGDGDNSSAGLSADLSYSAVTASGSSLSVASTRNVNAVANPPGTPVDPGVASKNQCDSVQAQVGTSLDRSKLVLFAENSAEQPPSSESELKEKQEVWREKRREEHSPTSDPQDAPPDTNESSPVGSVNPVHSAHTQPHQEAAAGRAGREGAVTPQPAPRLSLMQGYPRVSQADELSVGPSGEGEGSASGLALQNEKSPGAFGCLPQNGSVTALVPPVKLRADSSSRRVRKEGDEDLFDSLTNLKSALSVTGDHNMRLAALPAIPEAGSDDELQGDCQENHGVAADDQNISESVGRKPLHENQQESSDSSAAGGVTLSAGGGSAVPVLPAGGHGHEVSKQAPDSGMTSHSSEHSSCFEKQVIDTGVGERAESDFFEPSVSSSSLSCSSQPCSSSRSLSSDTPSQRAESPKKPTAEGFADKAGNSGKKKLLQAWVSPSETYPNQTQQSGETMSPKHRLHPVKPMNTTANKSQSKDLNVISTMNEKLLEMNIKKYSPSDPAYAYAQLTHDELIQLVLKQKDTITKKDLQVRELEDYIDNLLVRVMEETPNILRVSTSGNRKAGKM
ncbi:rab11 family-interacting protein 1 isoform X2 [Coturnix japonica]|uniref:Rab11 family-interacting protein 2 n=1 Tax=Coturnix japonica TaxID=93934 RepID=A0A8C2TW22_COTJA|nr:rab11 family-interacting protein 1 isoform X2 [Coturnix japonica]